MKNLFMKILSALLALLMIAAAFTVISVSPLSVYADDAADGEEGEEEEKKDDGAFKASDLETIAYTSEEDKLLTMCKQTPVLDANGDPVLDVNGNAVVTYSPWIVRGDYELYVQDLTGEVAVKNTKTGQILFTNPYDLRASITSNKTLTPMFSQLAITYETIKKKGKGTMYSYEESAVRNQIVVSYIKNGICVEYTIGRADERRLVPFWMERYRFEKLLLTAIPETEWAFTKMKSYYALLDMNIERPAKTVEDLEKDYPCLAAWNASTPNKTYTVPEYDPALESEYAERRANGEYAVPYSGRMSIYVLSEDKTTDYEKNKIEEYIRSYAPTYSYDTLAYDHELTGFVGKKNTLPVFKVALEYRVDEDGFSVRLPANSITFDEGNFRLTSVDVLPYMGAGSSDYTGYTFVPDGSGTLIRFEDVKNQSFTFNTGAMYGPDFAYHTLPSEFTGQAEIMRYPVFGVIEDTVKSYTMNDDGTTGKEICAHRIVKKTIEPDCATDTDGCDIWYCAICGMQDRIDNVKPYAHTFGGTVVLVEGNCQSYRKTEQTCTVCQRKITTVATELGSHNYEDFAEYDPEAHVCYDVHRCINHVLDADGNEVLDEEGNPVLCGNVDYKVPTDHTYQYPEDQIVRKDGVCYKTNVCIHCGYVKIEEIAHDYTKLEYLDEDGLCVVKKTCDCGHVIYEKQLHTMSDDAEKVYDTAHHVCFVQYTCKVCGATVREEIAHEYEGGVCKNCGFEIPTVEGHNLEIAYVSVGSVCYRTLKCADEGCNYEYTAARAAVPHKFADSYYVPATCTDRGYREFSCLHCGYKSGRTEVEEEEANALGHEFEWTTDHKTSCVEGYYSEYKCSRCGLVSETKTAPADGHFYETTKIIDPSEHGDGIFLHVCTFCGHEYYETRKYVPKDAPAPAVEEPAAEEPAAEEPAGDEEPAEGDEPAPVTEPVTDDEVKTFTVTHGYVAVMTEGSSMATLMSVHDGKLHKYNYVYMTVAPRPKDSYNLRDSISTGADDSWTVVSERKYNGSYKIKYYMLQTVEEGYEGKIERGNVPGVYGNSTFKAHYTGMAAAYRNYLTNAGVLTPLEQRDDGIPLYLEAFGAITINSTFLTVPRKEKKALNTFEDLKKIVGELNDAADKDGNRYSITNIDLKLTGFANNGMNYNVPYKVKFEKVVGGDKGFKDFVSFAKENNVGVYPDFDFAYMRRNTLFDGYTDSKHAVKTIDSRYIVKKTYNSTLQIFSNTGLLAISASVYDHFYTTFTKNYAKFENAGISASTLGTDLNSDFDKKEPYNREDSREFTERILRKMKADYGSVMVEGGNAYTFPYVKHILKMSLSGSNYLSTSESIPFLAMVLHGSISYAGQATNMSSSLDQEILHLIENGASPYFLIAYENTSYLKENNNLSTYYSLDYSTWKNDLIDTYVTLNDALKDVQYAQFVEHEFLSAQRVPDEDELDADYETAKTAITNAIKTYLDAVKRAENAKKLIERKSVTEPNAYRDELLELISKYGFADAEHSTMESPDVKLTEEDDAEAKKLAAKIAECFATASNKRLVENVTTTALDLERAEATFESTMSRYEYMFNVPAERRLDPAAYDRYDPDNGADVYRGSIYRNEQGEYVVASEGVTDADGNPVVSPYFINDKSVVKVGYDNGVEFYLNYNYYNVIVVIDGKNVVIPAYSFYKNA